MIEPTGDPDEEDKNNDKLDSEKINHKGNDEVITIFVHALTGYYA